MSDFYVDHAGLQRYADQVEATAGATSQARSYAQQWVAGLPADSGGKIFQSSAAAIAAFGTTLTQFLAQVNLTSQSSSDELWRSAQMYATTEQGQAENADRLLPTTQYDYNSGGGQ